MALKFPITPPPNFSTVQINKLPLDSTYIDITVCQEFITLRKISWCQNMDTVLSDDWALELVAHRGCGISTLGDIQKPPCKHGPWPPALVALWEQGEEQMDTVGLHTQPCCDLVIR